MLVASTIEAVHVCLCIICTQLTQDVVFCKKRSKTTGVNDVQEGTEDRALGRLRRYYAYLRSVLSARDTAGLRMAAEAAIQFL